MRADTRSFTAASSIVHNTVDSGYGVHVNNYFSQ